VQVYGEAFVMLQAIDSQQQAPYEELGRGFDLRPFFSVLKRRALYFAAPFVLIVLAGSLFVWIQRPIFFSAGKILVESQEIPVDLVRPTVTTAASERVQVIQQRMATRDNLLAIIGKYNLFPAQRKWMSQTQLLDLMKERTRIELIDLDAPNAPKSPVRRKDLLTIAFSVGFEYEIPELAMKVANDLVTAILNEDAKNRTNRAEETTKFLAREVKRLEAELGGTQAQVAEYKRRPRDPVALLAANSSVQDPNVTLLATLKTDLIQKSSVYSQNHPEIKALKLRIAALEQVITKAPEGTNPVLVNQVDSDLEPILRQQLSIERELEEATKKFSAARLGESLERDQQSERLQIIEQPTMPQQPTRPNRLKLFAVVFGVAFASGAGAMFATETMDRSIRTRHELYGIVDSHMIVCLPYILTKAEVRRKSVRIYMAIGVVAALLFMGILVFLFLGPPIDVLTADLDFSWLEVLTRLAK
jgi:uncharacterized protein involved in exopolysaccharide biosynthesis